MNWWNAKSQVVRWCCGIVGRLLWNYAASGFYTSKKTTWQILTSRWGSTPSPHPKRSSIAALTCSFTREMKNVVNLRSPSSLIRVTPVPAIWSFNLLLHASAKRSIWESDYSKCLHKKAARYKMKCSYINSFGGDWRPWFYEKFNISSVIDFQVGCCYLIKGQNSNPVALDWKKKQQHGKRSK